VCFTPKPLRDLHRLDLGLGPPGSFVSLPMVFSVMNAAQRNREFIADLPAKRPWLRKS
jgi:hypothetical protein